MTNNQLNPSVVVDSDFLANRTRTLICDNLDAVRKGVKYISYKWRNVFFPEDIEDCEQNAILKFLGHSAASFNPDTDDIRAWLWKSGYDAAIDFLSERTIKVKSTSVDKNQSQISDTYLKEHTCSVMRNVRHDFCDDYEDCDCAARPVSDLTSTDRERLAALSWDGCNGMLDSERRSFDIYRSRAWKKSVKALTEKYRILLHMKRDLSLSGEEIANILGMKHGAERTAISRAYDHFRTILKKNHFDTADKFAGQNLRRKEGETLVDFEWNVFSLDDHE